MAMVGEMMEVNNRLAGIKSQEPECGLSCATAIVLASFQQEARHALKNQTVGNPGSRLEHHH